MRILTFFFIVSSIASSLLATSEPDYSQFNSIIAMCLSDNNLQNFLAGFNGCFDKYIIKTPDTPEDAETPLDLKAALMNKEVTAFLKDKQVIDVVNNLPKNTTNTNKCLNLIKSPVFLQSIASKCSAIQKESLNEVIGSIGTLSSDPGINQVLNSKEGQDYINAHPELSKFITKSSDGLYSIDKTKLENELKTVYPHLIHSSPEFLIGVQNVGTYHQSVRSTSNRVARQINFNGGAVATFVLSLIGGIITPIANSAQQQVGTLINNLASKLIADAQSAINGQPVNMGVLQTVLQQFLIQLKNSTLSMISQQVASTANTALTAAIQQAFNAVQAQVANVQPSTVASLLNGLYQQIYSAIVPNVPQAIQATIQSELNSLFSTF